MCVPPAGRSAERDGATSRDGAAAGAAPPLSASLKPSLRVHAGHAPQPWVARVRSAVAICCSREARSARGAYWVPPKPAQVLLLNCSPP